MPRRRLDAEPIRVVPARAELRRVPALNGRPNSSVSTMIPADFAIFEQLTALEQRLARLQDEIRHLRMLLQIPERWADTPEDVRRAIGVLLEGGAHDDDDDEDEDDPP